jgi:hypothetical protein
MTNLAARAPTPLDFIVPWDNEHTFDFFEDGDGDALWASGDLPDEEFARQVNEYDRLCGSDWEGYTENDVVTLWAIAIEIPDVYIQPVEEGTENAGLIKKISR